MKVMKLLRFFLAHGMGLTVRTFYQCAFPSSLLDPLEGLSRLSCGKLELKGRSQLPALKGVRGAC